jgi:tetratricopeptide (TPR) repeat protein
MFIGRQLSIVFVIGFLAALAGCASDPRMTKEQFVLAMGESGTKVDSLLEKGNAEDAIQILDQLARRNPDRKEPWARMARIQFDSGNYAQAIVSAEEVLQRDSADRTAKSIRAVAGLRVATQSLSELRNDVELKGDARSDAVSLANVMRETLGEDVLVPPAELEARKKRAAAIAARARARATRKPQAEGPPASGGNPFSLLR